ncbi:flavodoxin family protein [Campylobacter sp. MIT 12-5580]|nr:flavodoxin family protein [Campylobacter sp. MIT 12-5580]
MTKNKKGEQMKTLVLFSHSYYDKSSVNKTLLEALSKEQGFEIHNLNLVYPNGKINIKAEFEKLQNASRILVQFPLFWYSTPSIFKEWQDEVLTPIYEQKLDFLKDKKVGFVVTAGGSVSDFKELDNACESGIERTMFALNTSFEGVDAKITKPFVIFSANANNLPLEAYLDYAKNF